ncbi:MAG: hypothetical protein J1F33_02895 [Clostridiales bacterium]|nr:hypothetical protein [Clostridiales bacterium]
MKKISALIISALVAAMIFPTMTGCADNGEMNISYTAPTTLPKHVLDLTLQSNYSMDDKGNIIKYTYTPEYSQNVRMTMTCERGYMPNVQFTLKKDDGTVINTITDENIVSYNFVYDENNIADKQKVQFIFAPFMTESPDCNVAIAVDKLEVKTAEHTFAIEKVNWMGNITSHFNDGNIKISFSGNIPKKSDGTLALDPNTRYDVEQLGDLFVGETWHSKYGDELIVTVRFPAKEVPPPTSAEEDINFMPLFYVYELFDGDRSVFAPVDVLTTTSSTTTLTTVIPIMWDYSLDLIVEQIYQICPQPEI